MMEVDLVTRGLLEEETVEDNNASSALHGSKAEIIKCGFKSYMKYDGNLKYCGDYDWCIEGRSNTLQKGSYSLLACSATSCHNEIPMPVRKTQLYRMAEGFLKKANLLEIRRTAATELAIADAVNIEKEVADKSNSKVEAYIKEHIRPLCKIGAITTERYRWVVVKTTDKVMKYHSKDKNANFLLKEICTVAAQQKERSDPQYFVFLV